MSKNWSQMEELAQLNAELDEEFPETIKRIGRGRPNARRNTVFYEGEGQIIENGSKVAFKIAGGSGGIEILEAKDVIDYDVMFRGLLHTHDKEKLNRARYKLIAYKHS